MRRLLVPRWLVIHAVTVGLVLLFVALGLWQLHRAQSGNNLSYAYAFEWPTFALLVIGFWAKVVRDEVRPKGDRGSAADPTAVAAATSGSCSKRRRAARDREAAELAAYNRYVADRARSRNSG